MKSIEDIDHQEIVPELLNGKEDESKNVRSMVLETPPPPLLFSKRLLVTVLLFFCYINFQLFRSSMNIAVVEMTSNKSIVHGNITILQPPEFNWDAPTIGVVISVINYGGLLAISNVFIVDKLGASTTCAISMFLASITTMLHPVILRHSFYAFLACRFSTGVLEILSVFKPILKSGPLWSFFILTFTYMWIASVITVCLPLYVKDLTGKESDEVGYISSIPNTVYVFMFPIAGAFMDFWKKHSKITTTKMHKIILTVAHTICVVFLAAITFFSDLSTSIIFFVLMQICLSFVPLLISIIIVNLAPNHVSHVASINVYFFTLGAIAAQTITGFMTTNHTSQEWNNCFLLTAAIAVFGNLIIVIFGSSEAQSWSLPPSGKTEQNLLGKFSD